ncbi:MAG: hypothetical protein MMC23_002538 [Stictis urceolatum]|nr:hypothetical protein [Stictis urceolata]
MNTSSMSENEHLRAFQHDDDDDDGQQQQQRQPSDPTNAHHYDPATAPAPAPRFWAPAYGTPYSYQHPSVPADPAHPVSRRLGIDLLLSSSPPPILPSAPVVAPQPEQPEQQQHHPTALLPAQETHLSALYDDLDAAWTAIDGSIQRHKALSAELLSASASASTSETANIQRQIAGQKTYRDSQMTKAERVEVQIEAAERKMQGMRTGTMVGVEVGKEGPRAKVAAAAARERRAERDRAKKRRREEGIIRETLGEAYAGTRAGVDGGWDEGGNEEGGESDGESVEIVTGG